MIKNTTLESQTQEQDAERRTYLLAELRCAFLRTKLLALDIEEIGSNLKFRVFSPEQAMVLLHERGLLHLISVSTRAVK